MIEEYLQNLHFLEKIDDEYHLKDIHSNILDNVPYFKQKPNVSISIKENVFYFKNNTFSITYAERINTLYDLQNAVKNYIDHIHRNSFVLINELDSKYFYIRDHEMCIGFESFSSLKQYFILIDKYIEKLSKYYLNFKIERISYNKDKNHNLYVRFRGELDYKLFDKNLQ